jgi:hypothetical protein
MRLCKIGMKYPVGCWWNSFIGLQTFGHVQRKGKFASKSGVILRALTAIGTFFSRWSWLHVESLWYSNRLERGCCMHMHTISTTSCVQAMRTLVKCIEEIRFGMSQRKIYEWVWRCKAGPASLVDELWVDVDCCGTRRLEYNIKMYFKICEILGFLKITAFWNVALCCL